MRLLLREKIRLRKHLYKDKDEDKKEEVYKLKERITNKEQESYFRRLRKASEEIKVDGKFSRGGF